MITPDKSHFINQLLAKKVITEEQLNAALALQKNSDKKLGEILIELGYLSEDYLMNLLSEQFNIPFIELDKIPLNPALIKRLPEFYARHFRAIIISENEDHYLIGMVDPQDLLAQDEIHRILNKPLKFALIRESDLLTVMDTIYRHSEEISHFAESLSAEITPDLESIFGKTQDFNTADMPVVNLLRSIFEDAVQVNASDIHIEPDEKILRVRLRVDGALQEQIINETTISDALVQRIKLMAGLNIAEKRLPQDGRFSINIKKKYFDVRVSTIPIQYGESVVMRLLNQSADLLKIDKVGMPPSILTEYTKLLTAAYGILLIVGPTGSGKTTTLYASLNGLNSAEDKIITVEDPVEYRIARVNQVQVNTKIGLTFANALRSILRQDPDIIMIGELRDQESVEIALRSALTGHFVLATLHTNDTISSVLRLLDMGAPSYLVASVLRAVIAQRLVRQICKLCKEPYFPTPNELAWLTTVMPKEAIPNEFKHGKGCTHCHNTGYAGRLGVFELLVMTDELLQPLKKNDTASFEALAKKQPLYTNLLQAGLKMAIAGETTLVEIIHMAGELQG